MGIDWTIEEEISDHQTAVKIRETEKIKTATIRLDIEGSHTTRTEPNGRRK
jgi:hypothetical protein